MKPETRTVKRRSTLEGENVKMGFASDATAHLMSVLTDLYKDRPLACVREYSTNALDAQIMAGVDRPIEVWTPTPLNPVLRVRDYGVGLNAAGIAEVYSQYGASTKRTSNEVNGVLGLGCKAALSYTDQFTVVGVKDGIKTVVAVSRDEEGGGDMRIVSTSDTDDANGVEIQIPTRPSDNFADIAAEFFKFWKPGTVLLNGKRPAHFTADSDVAKITDRIYTVNVPNAYGRTPDRDKIVMGGVAYPCHIDIDLPYNTGFVCVVNIGEVMFTPSRESLRDTQATKNTIARLAQEYSDSVIAAARADVEASATPSDAVRRINKWTAALPRQIKTKMGGFNYRDRAIPESITGPFTVSEAHGTLGHSRDTASLSTSLVPQTVFVHNYDLANFTPTHKKKLLLALEQHATLKPHEVRTFALSPTRKGDEWVADEWRLDWADVTTLKLPKTTVQAAGGSLRISGSYDVSIDGAVKRGLPAAEFDLSGNRRLVWANIQKWAIDGIGRSLADAGVSNFMLVQLPANRIEKFKRDFPAALNYDDFLRAEYKAWTASIPSDQRDALALIASGADVDTLKRMDPSKIDDPAVKRAIKLAKTDVSKTQRKDRQFRTVNRAIVSTITLPKMDDPLAPYLLIHGRGRYGYRAVPMPHVYDYMNHVYAGTKVAKAA